jgi:hypothetical protein
MKLDVPELSSILPMMMDVESLFKGQNRTIRDWVALQRTDIKYNLDLVNNHSDENDISILLSFLRDLLVRAMRGEAGELTYLKLKEFIQDKNCLRKDVYVSALDEANYRWGSNSGSELIDRVVEYFGHNLKWNWQKYLDRAEASRATNFADDYLLTVRHIGFKVRDLALSNFDPAYAAFDLHVARVPTRIGLLNYGFELLGAPDIEMGNNPADTKNYLFLHKLFWKLSDMTDKEFLPVDLDRIFWHFGRTYCQAKPKCSTCPINNECLTGKLSATKRITVKENQTSTKRRGHLIVPNGNINLPYGGLNASFLIQHLIDHLHAENRRYIIIGKSKCTFAEHKKPHSLDYWLRHNYTNRRDTMQAVDEVVKKLVDSGIFEEKDGLECPDSGRPCKGLAFIKD